MSSLRSSSSKAWSICQPCRRQILRAQGQSRQLSSTAAADATTDDVVPESSHNIPVPSAEEIKAYDPIARARQRKHQLPPSRYQFRPPKHYRGPLHPHQPPRPSDPASRLFVPGPFSLPRLEETYHSTLAPDLLTLLYTHHPPGQLPGPIGQRLREWDDSSPYHKGRALRKPRGGDHLPLLRRNITFRNLPRIEKIHVQAFCEKSGQDGDMVFIAAMIVQAISGKRAELFRARKDVQAFNWYKNMPCAAGVELRGEEMWHFLAKCVDVVMPRIKDFEGVSGKSGDGSGNIGFGFDRDAVGLFPEVEVNYDMYPPRKIPRINVMCCTTATTDREARLLMSALGVPFHGKHVN